MTNLPPSQTTKFALSPHQRQYIDSRIDEQTSEALSQLLEEIKDKDAEISALRAEQSLANARLNRLEDRFASDDKYVLTKANIVELMKRMGWYNGE